MISCGWTLRQENEKVLLRSTFNLATSTLLCSLYKPLSRCWLAHWANKLDIASVKLYGTKANALWVVPFAFVFAHEVLLIVILLAADAISISLCFLSVPMKGELIIKLETCCCVWLGFFCHALARSWFDGILHVWVWRLKFVLRSWRSRESAIFLVFAVLLLGQNDVNFSSFYFLVSQSVNPLYFVHFRRLGVHGIRGSPRCWLDFW